MCISDADQTLEGNSSDTAMASEFCRDRLLREGGRQTRCDICSPCASLAAETWCGSAQSPENCEPPRCKGGNPPRNETWVKKLVSPTAVSAVDMEEWS